MTANSKSSVNRSSSKADLRLQTLASRSKFTGVKRGSSQAQPQSNLSPSILFLNRSYYPDAEATGQLLTELCEDLAQDFNVSVVAGQPNQNPTGAKYRKYGLDQHRGVTIHRVPHTQFHKASLLGRISNLLTYLLAAALAALTRFRPDVVIVETDPPLLCLIGDLLKRWKGCKLVIYLQDIYPDLAIALGKLPNGFLARFLRRRFLATYHRADRMVVLSRDMAEVLIEAGISPDKITVIPNWIDTTRLRPVKTENAFRRQHQLQNRFIVMYSGNLGLCQDLDTILEAAALLRSHPRICFVLIGDGARRQALEKRATDLALINVRFVNYQPLDQLSVSLSAADLHLVPVDARVSRYLMPSKLYSALASATPILAVAPLDSELATLVTEHGVGLAVPPAQPQALADAILDCAEPQSQDKSLRFDLAAGGRRARALAEREFTRDRSAGRFRDMLIEVLSDLPSDTKAKTAEPDEPEDLLAAPTGTYHD